MAKEVGIVAQVLNPKATLMGLGEPQEQQSREGGRPERRVKLNERCAEQSVRVEQPE